VTPKQARKSPLIILGSHSLFCVSLRCLTIACNPKMLMWMLEQAAKTPAEAPATIIIIDASVTPRPAPPYSTGMAMPSHPPSATALANSNGKVWVRSGRDQ
jgi:hypothetical protein